MNKKRQARMLNEIQAAMREHGGGKQKWTVMAPNRDPYRLPTKANRRNGLWLREGWDRLNLAKPNHDRGLHYGFLGEPMPEGMKEQPPQRVEPPAQGTDESDEAYARRIVNWKPETAAKYRERLERNVTYRNTFWHAQFMQSAVKSGRWLDQIPWEWVIDMRNDEPVRRAWVPQEHSGKIGQPLVEDVLYWLDGLELPDADGLLGEPVIEHFDSKQRYQIALCGEKTSLRAVLEQIAEKYGCHLYLGKGDFSEWLIYDLAVVAAADGRELIILYFSDSDMSGWNMPIVVSRKLSALKHNITKFKALDFRVYRAGLRPDQVLEMDLPQEPLKPDDKRGPAWAKATGTLATELDALLVRDRNRLRSMAIEAIEQFHDGTLDERTNASHETWKEQVRELIEARDDLIPVRQAAAERLAEIQTAIGEFAEEIKRLSDGCADGIELPDLPELPESDLDADDADLEVLCNSDWDFAEQTRALIESKKYAGMSSEFDESGDG